MFNAGLGNPGDACSGMELVEFVLSMIGCVRVKTRLRKKPLYLPELALTGYHIFIDTANNTIILETSM